MPYCFGLYHWRRRARAVAVGVLAAVAAASRLRKRGSLTRRVAWVTVALWGVAVGGRAASKLARPPPWRVDRAKYEALAAELPLSSARRALDVGCGTGRSLVGLAPAVGRDCAVVGVDVFDDRVIFGNGPKLARRNAARAGLAVAVVRGDAARLPVADDSMDVVTACRVLHDLPRGAARRTLVEARRVCRPDGRLGVLELPIPHDETAEPVEHWRTLVADAGWTVDGVAELERERGRYIAVFAEPGDESPVRSDRRCD